MPKQAYKHKINYLHSENKDFLIMRAHNKYFTCFKLKQVNKFKQCNGYFQIKVFYFLICTLMQRLYYIAASFYYRNWACHM